jgi:hypothetical protein
MIAMTIMAARTSMSHHVVLELLVPEAAFLAGTAAAVRVDGQRVVVEQQ